MQPELIRSLVHELEKHAVDISTLQSYLTSRAGQGIGGAAALAQSLKGTTARTSREALQAMDGLQRFRLQGIAEGGRANRAMQALPGRVGLGQTAQATRQRVEDAVRAEAAGASTRTGVPLSKHYEGYMTGSQRGYSPEHAEAVMGLKPGQYDPKSGPTRLMKPSSEPISSSGTRSVSDVTVPSRPNIPRHAVPTVRPPARPLGQVSA